MSQLTYLIVSVVVVVSVLLWTEAARRWRAGIPLLKPEGETTVPWGLVDLMVVVGLWVGVNVAVALWARHGLGVPAEADFERLPQPEQSRLLLVGSVMSIFLCGTIVGYMWLRYRTTLTEFGFDVGWLVGDCKLGLRAFAMLAPIVYGLQLALTQFFPSKHPLIELLKHEPNPRFFLVSGFTAVMVAPIVEEFLFRGLLQGWLERAFATGRSESEAWIHGGRDVVRGAESPRDTVPDNPEPPPSMRHVDQAAAPRSSAWLPIFGSAGFFALSHLGHGPDPIPLFVLAIGLGYLYQRTRRIWPSLIVHFLLNLCSLVALWQVVTAPNAKP